MTDVNLSLASQCLAFCKELASHNTSITFTLTLGSGFAFSLDTKEKLPPVAERRKSPSARRRNARRRADFLKKKAEYPASRTAKQAEDLVDVTLAAKDGCQVGAHKVVISCSDPTEEEDVFEDAPSTLPPSSSLPSKPFYSHVVASSLPLLPSTSYASASLTPPKLTPVPTTTAKLNRLSCTHCGLPKRNHPGPSGDGCMLDTNGSQLL